MHPSPHDIRVTLNALPDIQALQDLWLDLEARGNTSFFISWSWIGRWLRDLPDGLEPMLLMAEQDGKAVGLGVLVRRTIRRHGLFISRGLFLNAAGDPYLDELTIEHNGLLVDKSLEREAKQSCLDFLVEYCPAWDEFFLDGIGKPEAYQQAESHGFRLLTRNRRRCYFINLEKLREEGKDYLSVLSSNTRYQVRRSIKEYGGEEVLRLEVAETPKQAREFLEELKRLHQIYWNSKGQPGSFANKFFNGFHNDLVQDCIGRAEVQLIQVRANARVLGYLYNFVKNGRVYNYQSGFDYSITTRNHHPGLVCHYLAVEYNRRLGNRVYDLLAGDGQYKRSLGTDFTEMWWLVVQRDCVKFRIEERLRAFKQRVKRRANKNGPEIIN